MVRSIILGSRNSEPPIMSRSSRQTFPAVRRKRQDGRIYAISNSELGGPGGRQSSSNFSDLKFRLQVMAQLAGNSEILTLEDNGTHYYTSRSALTGRQRQCVKRKNETVDALRADIFSHGGEQR